MWRGLDSNGFLPPWSLPHALRTCPPPRGRPLRPARHRPPRRGRQPQVGDRRGLQQRRRDGAVHRALEHEQGRAPARRAAHHDGQRERADLPGQPAELEHREPARADRHGGVRRRSRRADARLPHPGGVPAHHGGHAHLRVRAGRARLRQPAGRWAHVALGQRRAGHELARTSPGRRARCAWPRSRCATGRASTACATRLRGP